MGHSTPPPLEDLVSPERSLGVWLIWVPCSLLAKEFPGEGVSGVHHPDFRPSLVLAPQFCEHPLPPSPSAELSQSCKSTACNQNNLTDVHTVTGGRLREHLTQPFILQLNKLMDVRASSLSALSESALFLSIPTAQ